MSDMPKIQIDKGIPIPEKHTGRPATYPLKEMEIGDSFLIPFPDNSKKARRYVRNQAYYVSRGPHARKFGLFTYRLDPDGTGARVWRVK